MTLRQSVVIGLAGVLALAMLPRVLTATDVADSAVAAYAEEPLAGGQPQDDGGAATVDTPGPLRLTLADAIARGLDHNLAAVLAREGVNAASGAQRLARSGVLPTVEAGLAASRQKINLEEYGIPAAPGESPLIGPYDVVSGSLSLSQALFDWGAIQRARAGRENLAAAQYSFQDVRDQVVVACAGLYLQAVTSGGRVEAAEAQLATAEALARRAQDLRQAGTVAGIEVLRADVQLAAQRQRLIRARNELSRVRLALARAIGVPLGQELDLVDRVPFAELAAASPEQAVAQALAGRSVLKSARAALRAAEDGSRAASGDGLPSLVLAAELAQVGQSVETAEQTYSIAAAVRIPLFEGGRVRGRVLESRAAVEQQRAKVADLEAQVEYEVRTALLDLDAAAQQVGVASGARDLAEQQLVQAEDRFAAGVASNLEVVQAQQAVAEATESYLSSLLAHNLAKLALARALGVVEAEAGSYLRGGE